MLAVVLYLGYYVETPVANPPDIVSSLAAIAGSCVIASLAAALINRLTLRKLRRRECVQSERRTLHAYSDLMLRGALVALYVLALDHSSFPWAVEQALGIKARGGTMATQLLGLLPYMALFFAIWMPAYRLHKEVSPGVWTRRSFIVHKARYNLYMLLTWIPFVLLADWLERFLILMPVLFLAVAWTFPFFLAKAWGCSRLPEGETLDLVRRLERRAGAKFSQVYLWEPGGGSVQNAAAVGVFRPFRYLFLTPALVRNMREPELEAVIYHELGHVKKRHLLFYLFTTVAGINCAVLAGYILTGGGSEEHFAATAILIFLYFRFGFGWLSRNMERQADLFALEKTGSARGMANALEKLGLAAGNIRLAASWHHLGIAERVEYLRQAERNPMIARAHNMGVAAVMIMGYALSILVLGVIAGQAYGEYAAEPAISAPAPEKAAASHWRRVMQLMPDDPRALLELAYTLAGNPEKRADAELAATRAMRLAEPGEVREAAAKLLADLKKEGMNL